MILTQCPACRTLFRLSDEEQTACGGTVRCGHCGTVFQADVYRLGDAGAQEPPPARRRRGGWVLAIVLLAIGLAGQAAYWWRAELVAVVPWHRQTVRLIERLGLSLPSPIDVDAFHIRGLDVAKGRVPGVVHIRGQLANDAGFSQTPPLLAVSLLDAQGDLLVRRILPPADYLVHAQRRIGAHERAPIRLDLRGPQAAAAFRLGIYPRPAIR